MNIDELEKLNELKEKGIITQEEFDMQKKEILADFVEDETTKAKIVTRANFVSCPPMEKQNSISIFSILENIIRICFSIILILTIYFAPTGIAFCRNRLNTSSVFMLNLFLGWTLVAWVIALCWAFSSDAVDIYKKIQKNQ